MSSSLDALVVKVKQNERIANCSIYLAVGVNLAGRNDFFYRFTIAGAIMTALSQ